MTNRPQSIIHLFRIDQILKTSKSQRKYKNALQYLLFDTKVYNQI